MAAARREGATRSACLPSVRELERHAGRHAPPQLAPARGRGGGNGSRGARARAAAGGRAARGGRARPPSGARARLLQVPGGFNPIPMPYSTEVRASSSVLRARAGGRARARAASAALNACQCARQSECDEVVDARTPSRSRALAWTLPRPQQFLDVVQGAVDTEENGQFECGSDPADNILGTPQDQVVAGINYKVGTNALALALASVRTRRAADKALRAVYLLRSRFAGSVHDEHRRRRPRVHGLPAAPGAGTHRVRMPRGRAASALRHGRRGYAQSGARQRVGSRRRAVLLHVPTHTLAPAPTQ